MLGALRPGTPAAGRMAGEIFALVNQGQVGRKPEAYTRRAGVTES